MSMPDYRTNDPRGWCGDKSRGAAMGRSPVNGDPDYAGKLTLQLVPLNAGGYDRLGTYWGHDRSLYWYASADGTIDGTVRALNRSVAKWTVGVLYPKARFWR